uniref:Uncharacterized protein n=1 Tax=Anopheles christyi TaxID=43041 RepID=A0A182K8E8_9DIPT
MLARGQYKAALERQSRSRQQAPRIETPPSTCTIDRETVLKINRRPPQRRHRSCDNFWPPRSPSNEAAHDPHFRHPAPSGRPVGDALPIDDHGEFAIDSRRYGSHDSIHFDEHIRRQHKIEPLRTLFDKENVVLTDWGQRPHSTPLTSRDGHPPVSTQQWQDKNDNHVYGSSTEMMAANKPCHTSAVQQDNCETLQDDDDNSASDCTGMPVRPATPRDTDGPVLNSNCVPGQKDTLPTISGDYQQHRKEVHPPEPPPRRYYLPMDKIVSGELEAMLRLFQDTPITPDQQQQQQQQLLHHRESPIPGRRSATPSYGGKAQLHERSHSAQGYERHSNQTPASLVQDGVESKPPLKLKPCTGRTTPRSALQRHPTVTDVSCIEAIESDGTVPTVVEHSDAVEVNHEFNLNSNTSWNLNIDRRHDPPNGYGKPPKQSYSNGGHSLPSVTCVSAGSPSGRGTDQLTTNYFDKHGEHPSAVRFPVTAASQQHCSLSSDGPTGVPTLPPSFPVANVLEIERRQDHKFDSNVNCTGYRRPTVGEFHNYNEKLITDTDDTVGGLMGRVGYPADIGSTPHQPLDECRITENRRQSHSSALNVSNQPNRNWINLNSNQIYHQQQQWRTSPRDPVDCQRMSPGDTGGIGTGLADAYHHQATDHTARLADPGEADSVRAAPPNGHGESGQHARETHVAYGTTATTNNEHANDNLQRHWPEAAAAAAERDQNHQLGCNYDNKSVRSHYRREASPSDNGQLPVDGPLPTPPPPLLLSLAHRYVTPSPPLPPYPLEPQAPAAPWRQRARSGSSGSSVKINEIFEFPPPPPYPCDCATSDMNPEDDELQEVTV